MYASEIRYRPTDLYGGHIRIPLHYGMRVDKLDSLALGRFAKVRRKRFEAADIIPDIFEGRQALCAVVRKPISLAC